MTYQWHIFLASLDPTKGSEQAGRRPVLVISREQINHLLPVINVIRLIQPTPHGWESRRRSSRAWVEADPIDGQR